MELNAHMQTETKNKIKEKWTKNWEKKLCNTWEALAASTLARDNGASLWSPMSHYWHRGGKNHFLQ